MEEELPKTNDVGFPTPDKPTLEKLKQIRKTKLIKISSILISIFLVIGLINGIWWIYLQLSGNKPSPMTNATPTPVATPSPTPEPQIDKADWENFEISKAGLSLSYPADWKVQELSGAILNIYKIRPVSRTIGVEVSVWLASGFSEKTNDIFKGSSQININGIEMDYVDQTHQGGYQATYKFNSINNNYIVIVVVNGGNDIDYFYYLNQIVKTFKTSDEVKVIQKTDEVAAGWQRVETDKFRIDIPQAWSYQTTENGIKIINNVISNTTFWSVNYYKNNEITKEEVIEKIGSQYVPERNEERSYITDWSYPALQVLVTSPSESLLYSQNIFVDSSDNSGFYVISNEGNKESRFTQAWRSFKLK
jgi:hypothetical protein